MNASRPATATEMGSPTDQPARDRAYNNAAAVVDSGAITAAWLPRGAAVRARADAHLDWAYGPAPRQSIDLFPGTDASLPLVVFFHGGYWQSRCKEDFSFIAEGPLAAGFSVALVGYTLAPDNSVQGIVQECRDALAFLRRASALPQKTFLLVGWSAGAHLAASLMNEPGVVAGLAISGVYDLEPLRHTYLNTALRLDETAARACSPLHHLPDASPPLTVAWGRDELPALQQQSERYALARAAHGLAKRPMPLAHAHHFSILDALASPQGTLTLELQRMARARTAPTTPSHTCP